MTFTPIDGTVTIRTPNENGTIETEIVAPASASSQKWCPDCFSRSNE